MARLQSATASNGHEAGGEPSRLDCSGGEPAVFHFHPPESLATGTSIEGNPYSVLYFPVNRELEENARTWASATNKDLRWLAARTMVYFKSDANAAILKGLLNDEATWDRRETLHMTSLAHPHRPDYLVRWEAWHVLAGWGYEAPRPDFSAN